MSYYLIGAIDIEDSAEYDRYVEAAGHSMIGHSAEPLAVDDDPTLLEGKLPAGRIILMRFETEAEMMAWYRSDAYQAAMKHRHKGARTGFLVAVKGGYNPAGE